MGGLSAYTYYFNNPAGADLQSAPFNCGYAIRFHNSWVPAHGYIN
jgi:hypothetical protein